MARDTQHPLIDPTETPLDTPRTWVEFTDPDEPGQRFRCDLSWLTSSYGCLFGTGCPGVDATFPTHGCCTLGAHLTDADDLERVRAAVRSLGPEEWQLRDACLTSDDWWEEADEEPGEDLPDGPELKTRVIDGACILFNRSDHPAGAGCALHQHALAQDLPPHTLKPDVCWQLPLRRTYREVALPDGSEYLEVTIGEYDRRGWGPGGHDLDWYCSGSPAAHTSGRPLYLSSGPELRELMGEAAYAELARHCEVHLAAAASPLSPHGILIHPATLAAGGPRAHSPR